jgi:hypothetical protein
VGFGEAGLLAERLVVYFAGADLSQRLIIVEKNQERRMIRVKSSEKKWHVDQNHGRQGAKRQWWFK